MEIKFTKAPIGLTPAGKRFLKLKEGKMKFINAKTLKPTKHILEVKRVSFRRWWYWRVKARNGKIVLTGEIYQVRPASARDKKFRNKAHAMKEAVAQSKKIARAEALAFGKHYKIPVYIQDEENLHKYHRLY
jgi:hypothetical protein